MQNNNSTIDYKTYLSYLPEVKSYLEELEHQDLWWTTVGMVGKINNENIDTQLLVSIVETQQEFQNLRDLMIKELISRYLNQTNSEITLKTQTTIDILIRNLFERTADVGFLATDDDLVEFMAKDAIDQNDIDFISHRIEEYVQKYSVYDDVLLISPNGEVKAKLDENNPATHSFDPLIEETLTTDEEYIEVYRHSDMFPNKPASLIYAKKIVKPNPGGSEQVVGVLCLSFNFEDEMKGIYQTLDSENRFDIMLLDDEGKVLSSNNHNTFPAGRKAIDEPHAFTVAEKSGENTHFASKTNGYQGFYGLPWYSYIKIDNQSAFRGGKDKKDLGVSIKPDSPLYLKDLEEVNIKVSTLLLIVILNGKIMSLKRDVKSFLPILDSFQNISVDIQNIFSRFIHHIHQVLVDTIQTKAVFSATLATEIMDRNLYERANDCRWWALNSCFRKVLTQKQKTGSIDSNQTQRLTDILSYINSLYTVYTNLIIYDFNGVILAVSNQSQSHLVGTMIPRQNDTNKCLGLTSTQSYNVSDFHQTALYDDKYTYIYHATVKDWEDINRNVGGIAVVFDSEPEFKAMLEDTQPKYMNETLNETTFSLFVDRQGMVISSTSDKVKIGSEIPITRDVLAAKNGESDTIYWEWNDKPYLVGYKVSNGYREYKNGDGYDNDVIALMFTGI